MQSHPPSRGSRPPGNVLPAPRAARLSLPVPIQGGFRLEQT